MNVRKRSEYNLRVFSMMKCISLLLILMLSCGMNCFSQSISGKIDGYDYVDLRLPSGTLWATCNVGATSSTECGNYYAWGETKPKNTYTYETYKWVDQNKKGMYDIPLFTKYCRDEKYGVVDNKDMLEDSDDAATATWGKKWRMPTYEEQRELIDNCTWKYVENYKGSKVYGYLGTSKKNKKTIFLPCCGHYGRSGFEDEILGFYWAKNKGRNMDLFLPEPDDSYYSIDSDTGSGYAVFHGQSVRAVVVK